MTTFADKWRNWSPESGRHLGAAFMTNRLITRKNAAVDPPLRAPYLILVCLARSSALSIGESILSTVKKAAKLAVYDDIMIRVKNHHIPATMRVETALKPERTQNVEKTCEFFDS
jgi:hypothetical protein